MPLDTTTAVDTPERVRFRYRLAGPGRREPSPRQRESNEPLDGFVVEEIAMGDFDGI